MSAYDPSQRYRVFLDDQIIGTYSNLSISKAVPFPERAFILDTQRIPKGWYTGEWGFIQPEDVPTYLKVHCLLLGIPL